MRGALLLALLSLAPAAFAEAPEPVTAAEWLPPVQVSSPVRVQRRFAPKTGHFQLDTGLDWLARGDFYSSPGVQAGGLYWFDERWALDLSASYYFSWLNETAREVRDRTGLVPDSRMPGWAVRAGARRSLGYGKLLFGESAIHLEPQVFARVALLMAEARPSPGLDFGAGLYVHWAPWLHSRFELAVFPHVEERSGWTFSTAVVPYLSVGVGAAP